MSRHIQGGKAKPLKAPKSGKQDDADTIAMKKQMVSDLTSLLFTDGSLQNEKKAAEKAAAKALLAKKKSIK